MVPDATVIPKISVVIQLSVIAEGSKSMTDSPDETRMVISSESVSAECQRTKGSRRAR
jgi:hypothetical protein